MDQLLTIFKNNPNTKTKNIIDIYYYLFILCISQFYFGYILVYLSAVDFNIIVTQYKIDFDVSIAQGFFQGVMPIGGAVGALSSAYFIGLFSRKNLIFFINTISFILCILSIVRNYKIFFIVRFFQGITCGMTSAIIPMIIRQISPNQISSITGTFANTFIISGIFFLYLFGYILGILTGDQTGGNIWKIIFLFPIITIICQTFFITKFYSYQTPKYLAHNNKTDELKQLIKQFYKIQYVDEMYNHYMKHHGPNVTPQEEQHRSNSDQKINKNKKGSKCALFYAMFYAFLCPMAGINVIMSYGGQVISAIAPDLKAIMPSLLMLFYLFTAILAMIFVKKYGRKYLTLVGSIGIAGTLYLISIAYFISSLYRIFSQILIVTSLIAYLLVYGITYAPVMWMWVSEALLPHTIGYAIMINWSGAALIMILFPILLNYMPDNNPGYIFLFFGIYVTLSIYVTRIMMIQTKDKYEHEIMNEYSKLDQQYFGIQSNPQQLQLNLIKK